jgi:hypothetical protein
VTVDSFWNGSFLHTQLHKNSYERLYGNLSPIQEYCLWRFIILGIELIVSVGRFLTNLVEVIGEIKIFYN